MPQSMERTIEMIQINNWLGKCGAGRCFAVSCEQADMTVRSDNPGEGGEEIPDWCDWSQAGSQTRKMCRMFRETLPFT